MTRDEATLLLGAIRVAYPRAYQGMGAQDLQDITNLWSVMFASDDFSAVQTALYKHIATSTFAPTVAELRRALSDISHERPLTAGEAWQETIQAMQYWGYCRPEEAMAGMSPLTRQTVKMMGWTNLCVSENPIADRAHFMQIYEALLKRNEESRYLPIHLQNQIRQSIAANSDNLSPEEAVTQTESIGQVVKRLANGQGGS